MKANSTWDRLRGLYDMGVLNEFGYYCLKDTFEKIAHLRLKAHAYYWKEQEDIYCVYPELDLKLPEERKKSFPFALKEKGEIGDLFEIYKRLLSFQKALVAFCQTKTLADQFFSTLDFAAENSKIAQWIVNSRLAFYRAIAKIHSDNPRILLALAEGFQESEEYQDAIDCYSQAFAEIKRKTNALEHSFLTIDQEKVFAVIKNAIGKLWEINGGDHIYLEKSLKALVAASSYLSVWTHKILIFKQIMKITDEKIEEDASRLKMVETISGAMENVGAAGALNVFKQVFLVLKKSSNESVENNALRVRAFGVVVGACLKLSVVRDKVVGLELALDVVEEVEGDVFRANMLFFVGQACRGDLKGAWGVEAVWRRVLRLGGEIGKQVIWKNMLKEMG